MEVAGEQGCHICKALKHHCTPCCTVPNQHRQPYWACAGVVVQPSCTPTCCPFLLCISPPCAGAVFVLYTVLCLISFVITKSPMFCVGGPFACRGQFGPDAMYLRTALSGLFKRYNIDRKRVALAGFSDGATIAISLLPLGAIASHIIAWSPGGFAPPLVVSDLAGWSVAQVQDCGSLRVLTYHSQRLVLSRSCVFIISWQLHYTMSVIDWVSCMMSEFANVPCSCCSCSADKLDMQQQRMGALCMRCSIQSA